MANGGGGGPRSIAMRTLLAAAAVLLLTARALAEAEAEPEAGAEAEPEAEDPSKLTMQAVAEAGAAYSDLLGNNTAKAEVNLARAFVDMLRALVEMFAVAMGVAPAPAGGNPLNLLGLGLGGYNRTGGSGKSKGFNIFNMFS